MNVTIGFYECDFPWNGHLTNFLIITRVLPRLLLLFLQLMLRRLSLEILARLDDGQHELKVDLFDDADLLRQF